VSQRVKAAIRQATPRARVLDQFRNYKGSEFMSEFDNAIVSAGWADCVLAKRLKADLRRDPGWFACR